MADYITCTIFIGGNLSADKAEALDELLSTYTESSRESGKPASAQGEAAGGDPKDLTEFCVEHGLPYWRHHDAKYDVDPWIYVYDPTTAIEEDCAASSDYKPLLDADKLKGFATIADALSYLDRFSERVPTPDRDVI